MRDSWLQNFFTNHPEINNNRSNFILAVSGGIDSMVLLDLFKKAKLSFNVAHCNFNLRGSESDNDEKFVETVCQSLQIPFYSKSFDVEAYRRIQKRGIQESARAMRYEWFEQLRHETQADYIVTAHHKNDSVETLLMNLIRGAGIKGLRGILPIYNHVIRPMLEISKQEIVEYALNNNIVYREDSSNAKSDYTRNKIRHQIIPELLNINPKLIEQLSEQAKQNALLYKLIKQQTEVFKSEAIQEDKGILKIDSKNIHASHVSSLLLFEVLRDYGFSFLQIQTIIQKLDKTSGLRFESSSHILIKDRTHLVISSKAEQDEQAYLVTHLPANVNTRFANFNIRLIDKHKVKFEAGKLFFDADLIQFPIQLRIWKPGDKIRPLGMKGYKNISDILIDKKINLIEKKRCYVLLDASSKIIALSHNTTSHIFRISESTKNVACWAIV